MPKVDVVIAGGGAVGSAIAYFLTESSGLMGTVAVVASAVGEGSVVVQAIHARLAALRHSEAREPVTL